MELGQRLAALRNRRHLTQDQVAEALGIKRARYNAWENGISSPDVKMLGALSSFYKVTVDFLLGLPHPDGVLMLSSEQYADGYTDESVFEDLESSLKDDYEKLSKKDEIDIARELERLMSNLESDEALAFDGEPMNDEDKELLRMSLENSLRMSKQIAKKKFTPKKYRK